MVHRRLNPFTFLSCLFFLYGSPILMGQDSLTFYRLDKHKYWDGYHIDELHMFKSNFIDDEYIYGSFKKFNNQRKAQRFLNFNAFILTSPFIVLGCGSQIFNKDSYLSEVTKGICLGSLAFNASLTIPANAIFGSLKRKHKRHFAQRLTQSEYYEYIDKYSFKSQKD